jgi:hypothetical protein
MHICIYVFIGMYVHVYLYLYMYAYIHILLYVCIYTYIVIYHILFVENVNSSNPAASNASCPWKLTFKDSISNHILGALASLIARHMK